MSDILIASSVVMLLLLFLKVPVFISVLGGSLVYFVMNPAVNPVIFEQVTSRLLSVSRLPRISRMLSVASGHSLPAQHWQGY